MNALSPIAGGIAPRVTRAGWRTLGALGLFSLSAACGSAEGGPAASGGGSAGAAGSVGLAGTGANGGAAGQGAGGGGPSGGAAGRGGSAGASGGSVGRGGSAGASGGSGAAAGGSGQGGARAGAGGGAAQAPACPAVPSPNTACDSDGQVCYYEDCAGLGRSVATCQKRGGPVDRWSVDSVACDAVHCTGLPGSMSCASGQVCAVSQGGTISGMCVQATCGTGPITCECAHASCADCAISGTPQQGFTVTCNSCPQGGCP